MLTPELKNLRTVSLQGQGRRMSSSSSVTVNTPVPPQGLTGSHGLYHPGTK